MLPAEVAGSGPLRDGSAERLEDSLGQDRDVLAGRHVLNEDGELVTAEPCCGVERPQAARRGSFATRLSKLVPLSVAQAVVHRLEVVEVDEEHGQMRAGLADASQGVLEPVLEQRLVGQAGQGVVEGPVFELVLQPDAVGDVAEAPDPADDLAVHRLRPGGQLEGPPVLELERVEALVLRLRGKLPVPAEEGLRVEQLVEDERRAWWSRRQPSRSPCAIRQISENRRLKPVMVPSVVDDEDPVDRRVEGGGEERQGVAQLVLGCDLCRGVVGRDHEALHRGVLNEVDDAQFERHRGLPVVADELRP